DFVVERFKATISVLQGRIERDQSDIQRHQKNIQSCEDEKAKAGVKFENSKTNLRSLYANYEEQARLTLEKLHNHNPTALDRQWYEGRLKVLWDEYNQNLGALEGDYKRIQ